MRKKKWHRLKVWPSYFRDIIKGIKTFEIRKDDRDFQIGDRLVLEEYLQNEGEYTGNVIIRFIVYKFDKHQFGLECGYCILGMAIPVLTPAQVKKYKNKNIVGGYLVMLKGALLHEVR